MNNQPIREFGLELEFEQEVVSNTRLVLREMLKHRPVEAILNELSSEIGLRLAKRHTTGESFEQYSDAIAVIRIAAKQLKEGI
jgi:hypothetical protein